MLVASPRLIRKQPRCAPLSRCRAVAELTSKLLAQPQAQRPEHRRGDLDSLFNAGPCLIAAFPAIAGQTLAGTCSAISPFSWPLFGYSGAVIHHVPIALHECEPNARLIHISCPCGNKALHLVASQHIPAGHRIYASLCYSALLLAPTQPYISIMFDGSCPCPRALSPAGGSGVVVVLHLPGGSHLVLCVISQSIEGIATAQVAEAFAARMAVKVGLLSGVDLMRKHNASHIIIRGDSRVIAMNYNGHGLIKSPLMSSILLPLKSWASRAPWIKAFQHVARAYNAYADRAANLGAQLTLALLASPHLPRLLIHHPDDHPTVQSTPELHPISYHPKFPFLCKLFNSGHSISANEHTLLEAHTTLSTAVSTSHGLGPIQLLQIDPQEATRPTRTTSFCGMLTNSFLQYLCVSSLIGHDQAVCWVRFLSSLCHIDAATSAVNVDNTHDYPKVIYLAYLSPNPITPVIIARPLGLPLSAGDLCPVAISLLYQHLPCASLGLVLPLCFAFLTTFMNPSQAERQSDELLRVLTPALLSCTAPSADYSMHLKQCLRGQAPTSGTIDGTPPDVSLILTDLRRAAHIINALYVQYADSILSFLIRSHYLPASAGRTFPMLAPSARSRLLATGIHAHILNFYLANDSSCFAVGAYVVHTQPVEIELSLIHI